MAPLLLVGAAVGALIANLVNAIVPAAELSVTALAIVVMSTFFAAVVGAPFTGVVLIVEMAASPALLVPMILSALVRSKAATAVKGAPIHETLRLRMEGRYHWGPSPARPGARRPGGVGRQRDTVLHRPPNSPL